jgi:hypothetical protein
MAIADVLGLGAVDAVAEIARGDLTAEHYASTLLAQCEAGTTRLRYFVNALSARYADTPS